MAKRYAPTDLRGVEDALEIILSLIQPLSPESMELLDCQGRVLSDDIASDIDIAPFANSAMDGFAICSADTLDASKSAPVCLEIIGVIGAGIVYEGVLSRGQALRIMTGAPLPEGADAVIKIEACEVSGESAECPEGKHVFISTLVKLGQNVRQAGEEAKAGDLLLRSGETINAAGVGLLATAGHATVAVYRRPRVAVLSSGNELVEVNQRPGPGQIRNSNTFALAAQAKDAGALVTMCPKVDDTPEAFLAAFAAATVNHDLVVVSGGAAEGDYDYTTSTIRKLGEIFFNKVNMKPGKAQTFGIINGVPVFGLAGNPAAAAVGFEILVRPALRKMQGYSQLTRPVSKAHISVALEKKGQRREYLRAQLSQDTEGNLSVTPAKNQSSALLRTLYQANCLLLVPEGQQSIPAGSELTCVRLDVPEGVLL